MASDVSIALVTGAFTLGAGVGGVLLAGWQARKTEERHLAAEDARRWLDERRRIYANYLGLVEALLHLLDTAGVFLPSEDGRELSEQDEAVLEEDHGRFLGRWFDDLQPALADVRMMASTASVADLADRVSGGLWIIAGMVDERHPYPEFHPAWFQAKDLAQVLRAAMRRELGLPAGDPAPFEREDDWPWLPDRPSRQSYVDRGLTYGSD